MATMGTPKFDLIPDVPDSAVPNFGVPANRVGGLAFLPALGAVAGMASGNPATGQAIASILSVPAQVAEYQASQEAARYANKQQLRAIAMVENAASDPAMSVSRPAEWSKINPKIDAVARMAAARRAWGEKTREQSEATQQAIAETGGEVSPYAEADILGAVERVHRLPMQEELGKIWEGAQEETSNLLLSIASQDISRKFANVANRMGLTQLAAGLLTGDISYSTAQQVFATVQEGINNAVALYQHRQDQQRMERMQEQSLNYGLAGAGISAAGNIAAAGVYGAASKPSAPVPGSYTPTLAGKWGPGGGFGCASGSCS